MGNFCSTCTSNELNNQHPLNLSQKFSNENEIKSNSGFSNSSISKESVVREKHDIIISESISLLLTKLCRGYLYRKHFNNTFQDVLLQFQKKLYEEFENKYTAYLPSNIWDYIPEQWADYSIERLVGKDNCNHIYLDRIIFEYDANTSNEISRYYKTPTELADIALSGYKGTIDKNYQKRGFGTLIFNTGKVKRGFWENNEFTGWNEIIESEGNILIGEFIKGILNGKGEQFNFLNKQDLYYKGDYVEGRREGLGVETINNCIFEGEFINNKKIKGKATYESGDTYEGSFDEERFNGEGHYIWKTNGHEYIGGYRNGKSEGKGIYKWSETEYYKGEYKNGVKEGQGELHMKNGVVFVGPFANGLMHGVGDYTSKNYKGKVEFINGQLNKFVPKKKNIFKNLYSKKAKEKEEQKSENKESILVDNDK